MSIVLSQRAYDKVCVVTVAGPFNKASAKAARDYLNARVDAGYAHLVVDVRACTAFTKAAVGVLTAVHARLGALDGWCRVVVSDRVRWRQAYDPGMYFDVYDGVVSAVDSDE